MKASTQFAILSLTLFGPTCGVFAQMPGPGGAMPMPVSALQPNGYAAMNPSGSAAVVAPQPIPMLDVRHSAAEGVYPPGGPYPGYELSQPFGPQINFEGVLERGNGWANNFYRGSAFVPHHIDPWTSLLLFDLAASGTDDGDGVYNFGVIYREYVESLQRVFGLNAYYDFDYGHQRERYQQFGFGIESLGKYCDFRANGYIVDGPDDYIISNQLLGDCTQAGHGFLFSRNELLESALTGGEIEAGGPLPFLGRYGLNFFAGGYYLDAENTDEAIGLKLRGEVLLTQSLTVNVLHSNDDVIGKNTWVNVAVSFPGWRNRRFLRNRPTVRERLGDRVIRDNRVHTVIATRTVTEEATNPDTNLAYNIFYVNPNSMLPGDGTVERPLGSLQMLANMNNAGIDIIRVDRRLDDTGTNLTVDGGLDLFDNQQLLSGTKSFNFQSVQGAVCQLPATNTGMTIPPLGPLISNPTLITNVAGVPINPLSDSRASVIRLADNNTVSGFRIDASDVTNSHFGIGIVNLAPITDFEITCNTFLNYADAFADTGSGGSGGAVVLSNVSGSGLTGIFDDNTMNGMAGADNGAGFHAAPVRAAQRRHQS